MLQIKARHIQAANFALDDPEKDLLYHEGQLAARRFYGVTEAHMGDDFVKVNQLIVKLKTGQGLKGIGLLKHSYSYPLLLLFFFLLFYLFYILFFYFILL